MHSGFPKEYEQLSSLGEGGMGTVYLAKQKAFDRLVAVKILKAELASQVSDRKRFLREAKFCAQVEDPNILGIIDSGIVHGIPYIVMEYVDGPNLQDLLKESIGLSRGLEVIRQVASALMAAHSKKIVHRDLKPENVLIANDGTVRVADWGISRALMDVEQLTKTGIVLGTPQYMAPEQILAKNIGPPCDLYSLGVMLFQVLTGRLPFKEENLTDLLQAHLHKQPPKLEQISPNMPSQLCKLVNSLLAKEPENRPTSRDVFEQLANLGKSDFKELSEQTAAYRATNPTMEVQHKSLKTNRLKLPMAALSVMIFLLLLFFMGPNNAQKETKIDFQIKGVALKDPSLLSFRYVGTSNKTCEITVSPNCAPSFKTKLDFSQDKQHGSGSKILTIKLPQPIIARAQISFSPVLLGERKVSVEALFKDALEPVSSLSPKRLDDFLSTLDKERQDLRSYMKTIREQKNKEKAERLWVEGHEKLTPQYEKVLADFNITKENMAKLRELMRKCDGCRAYANNGLIKKMAPLRMVEALLGDGGLVSLPWGKTQTVSAIEIKGEDKLEDFFKKTTLLANVNLVRLVSRENRKPRKSYRWIADKNFFSKFKDQGLANLAYAALVSDTNKNNFIRTALEIGDDEHFPDIEEIRYEFNERLMVSNTVKSWPPRECWLLVKTRGLSREIELDVELNRQQICSIIYVTSGFDPFELKSRRYHCLLIRVPPSSLLLGPNKIRIFPKSFPALGSKAVVGLLRVAAFGLFE